MIISRGVTLILLAAATATATAIQQVPNDVKSVLYHKRMAHRSSTGEVMRHTPSRLSCAVKATSNGAQGHAYVRSVKSCHTVTSISSGSESDWPVYWSPDAIDFKPMHVGRMLTTDDEEGMIDHIIPPPNDTQLVLVTTGGYLYYIQLSSKKILFETRFNGRNTIKAYYDDDKEALIVITPSSSITISVNDGKVTRKPHQYNFSDVVDLGSTKRVTGILRRKHLEILEGQKRKTVTIKQGRPQTMQISEQRRAVYWSTMQDDKTTITETFFSGKKGDVFHAKDSSMTSFTYRNTDNSPYLWGQDGIVRLTTTRQLPIYAVQGECFNLRTNGHEFDSLMERDDQLQLVRFRPLVRKMPIRENIPLDRIPEDAGKWTFERLVDVKESLPRDNSRLARFRPA